MMINTLTFSKTISNWQNFIQRERKRSKLFSISKQISQLKKELERSFPEFGDMTEITAIYNFYRELEALQQKINNKAVRPRSDYRKVSRVGVSGRNPRNF